VTFVDQLATCLNACRDDPALFNDIFLQRPPYWARQIEMCQSLVNYRTTAVYSGNAVGKDYWLAGAILWWLATRPGSLAIITGPSQTVLGSVTWKEIRRCLDVLIVPFGGKVSTGIRCSPHTVSIGGSQALGFSTTSVERSSGQHNAHLLAVVEEASGVEDYVFDAIDSLNYERLVCIGNPIRSTGRFVDMIRQADRDRADGVPPSLAVNAIRIPSTESPDAEKDRSPYGLADRTWLESMFRKYGRRSLWVGSHIDAIIPSVDAEQLIPPEWLDYHRMQVRQVVPPGHPIEMTRCIACDLGEGVGRDSSCVLVRDAWGILDIITGSAMGLPEAADAIGDLAARWHVRHERISFDKLGIGRNFPNHLARWGITSAIPYAGEGRPRDSTSFPNLRSECGWLLRNRLDATHAADMRAPSVMQMPFSFPFGEYYSRLVDELRPLTYNLIGKFTRILPKDDWTDAIGHSPDIADTLIQSMVHGSQHIQAPASGHLTVPEYHGANYR